MLPKRFDQARPFVTLGIVLLVWLLLPLGLKTFTRSVFFEIQAPLVVADSYIEDLQNFWASELHTKKDLMRAGRDLAGRIADYNFANQQNEHNSAEILRLEHLLRMQPLTAFRFEPARVARRDFNGWWARMTIRKGANHGIPVGAPVVFAGGVVGRVVEVHRYTAEVDMITSQSFRVAATVAGDSRPVSYQGGDNTPFHPPRGNVEGVPPVFFASPGNTKRLETSGLGGVFPPGLSLGEITSLELSPDGLFKFGEVALDERLGSLTEVTVLVPLNPEEP